MSRHGKICALMLTILSLSACVVAPVEKDIVNDGPLGPDEGIVFGTVDTVVVDRHERKLSGEEQKERFYFTYNLVYSSSDDIGLKHTFPGAYTGEVFAQGGARISRVLVAKRLAAGEYSIHSVNSGTNYFLPDIRFRVTPSRVTYLGSILFVFQSAGSRHGVERTQRKIQYTVVDDHVGVTTLFRNAYPALAGQAITMDFARVKK